MNNKIFLIVLFLLLVLSSYSQSRVSILVPPIDSNWSYFNLSDTTTVEVLEHNASPGNCGGRAFASITIVKMEQDTIRILDLCNENSYAMGEIVKIAPAKAPSFEVSVPYYYIEVNKSDIYYRKISMTTWGDIIAK